MDTLRFQIDKIFKGASKSFYRFPASIISAAVISIIAFIKITKGWEGIEENNFLFDSIQFSFLLGAVFSMAAVVFTEVKAKLGKSDFVLANISGIVLALISSFLLYSFGSKTGPDNIAYLTDIASVRVGAAVFICIVAFIYIVSKARPVDSFSDSFFITHRAFVISAIYGLVMMIGISGVLGAFQVLVYKDMDYRVYSYIAVIIGFITYTIFLGYFPSFRETEDEEEIIILKEQPRFIYVLLEYILIPIMLALTAVLLIWSLRVVLKGVDVSFNQLSGIASSYVIAGIWLHIMVSKHSSKLAEFYKVLYPFAGALILIFEAWALFIQISKFGLKTTEYSFLIIWIFAVISVFLLIFFKNNPYRKIALTAAVLAFISVLPIIGYRDITFNSQVSRLENTLKEEELLINGNIRAVNGEIEPEKKEYITEAVDFISYSEKENTPIWFKKELNDEEVFKQTFGFEKTYGPYPEEGGYQGTSYILNQDPVDISEYSLDLKLINSEKGDASNTFESKGDRYEVLVTNRSEGIPQIKIKLNDKVIYDESMEEYLENLLANHPVNQEGEYELSFEEMSYIAETPDASFIFVFSNIDTYFTKAQNKTDYYVAFESIFVKLK